QLVKSDYIVEDEKSRRVSIREIFEGMLFIRKIPRTIFSGSVIGAGMGIIPGIGSSIANIISYTFARQLSDDPKSYGKGNPNGLAAAESASSSSEGGSMVGLLALG